MLLHHYWKKGLCARATVQFICDVECGGSVSKSAKPALIINNGLHQAVEENTATGAFMFSAEFGTLTTTIVRHHQELGKVNKHCREVHHELKLA